MQIKVEKSGLVMDGEALPLVSGTMHYWRVARDKWEPILDMVKEMGFSVAETYIPWSAHEIEKGKFDFGEKDKTRAVEEFIKACRDRELKLIVRPGPHINAEITCFGYPERVLRRKECLSITVDNDPAWMPPPPKMWPAPSYAAEAFYEEVGGWFDALAPILKPYLAPEGHIVAIQVDNEFCNMFRNSAWDHDYHPDSIKLWRRFLSEKYGQDKSDVEPPREFKAEAREDLPFYLDWIEFKEYYMQNALSRLRRMWEERGVTGIPVFHNYPTGHDVPPNNYTELEKILDFHGPDMYPTKKHYTAQKALVSFASGLSRFPYIPEFSSGGFFWSAPLSVEDQRFTTPVCFMHGIKGINFYMIVERERWYGSPITRDGRKRQKQWELYVDFNKWFKKTRINELTKQASALLLSIRDYERLALATTLLDPAPPLAPNIIKAEAHCSEETFDFDEPIQIANETQWNALFHGLSAAKIPFDCGNTSQPLDALEDYPMVLCPTFGFLDSTVQEKLVKYAESGGLLVIGPRLPGLDAKMKPCSILQDALVGSEDLAGGILHECGQGRVVFITEPLPAASAKDRPKATTDLLVELATRFNIERPYPADDPVVETVLHRGVDKAVLFVANPTGEDRTAKIESKGEAFTDAQSGEQFKGDTVEIPVPAYTVRIFELG
jgi:beta-galactosidase